MSLSAIPQPNELPTIAAVLLDEVPIFQKRHLSRRSLALKALANQVLQTALVGQAAHRLLPAETCGLTSRHGLTSP